MITHASVFSGIGAPELAAQRIGWKNLFHCEIEPFPRKILQYYWPKAVSYEDIRKTDFTVWRGKLTVLSGGFPCQPFSLAGKRKGTNDPRNLWPEYHRAIREIQPRYVVAENVPGIVNWSQGLVFEQVQSDLETEGYQVAPVILPACSTGAPHIRERVFFVAYSGGNGHEPGQFKKDRSTKGESKIEKNKRERVRSNFRRIGQQRITPDAKRKGLEIAETKNQQHAVPDAQRGHTQKNGGGCCQRPGLPNGKEQARKGANRKNTASNGNTSMQR